MAPNLFESPISSVPRMRAWMFSSVVSSGRPLNSSASAPLKDSNVVLDGDLVVAHAQARGHVARVDPADVGGVGRGHHHRADLVLAQCIDRDGQHQRRVDAARQAQDGARKAVLADVVAHAEHQGVPELGLSVAWRCDGRRLGHEANAALRRALQLREDQLLLEALGLHAPQRHRPATRTKRRRTPPRPARRPGARTPAAGRRRAPGRPCARRARLPCPRGTATH